MGWLTQHDWRSESERQKAQVDSTGIDRLQERLRRIAEDLRQLRERIERLMDDNRQPALHDR